jgi:hypothetical protein
LAFDAFGVAFLELFGFVLVVNGVFEKVVVFVHFGFAAYGVFIALTCMPDVAFVGAFVFYQFLDPRVFVSLPDRLLFNAHETLVVVFRFLELEEYLPVIFVVWVISQHLPEIQTSFLCQCINFEEFAFIFLCLNFFLLLTFKVVEESGNGGDVLFQKSLKEFFRASAATGELLEHFKQV